MQNVNTFRAGLYCRSLLWQSFVLKCLNKLVSGTCYDARGNTQGSIRISVSNNVLETSSDL